jgi:release factor glutamine methyltransferase
VPDARLEADLLLGDLLDLDRGGLLFERERPLDPSSSARFDSRVARRASREPLQQILGWQEFHGLRFQVDRHVLIPRPETELLVDLALGLDLPRGSLVVDLGSGSGCIAVTLALKGAGLHLIGLDLSAAALEMARRNVAEHGVRDAVELVEADLGDGPPESWRGKAALVVSNPPYVAAADWESLEPEVRDHEPREALVPGPTGLEAYRVLAPAAGEWLAPGGGLLLELGLGQEAAVREIVDSAGFDVLEVRSDLRGVPRALLARRSAALQ